MIRVVIEVRGEEVEREIEHEELTEVEVGMFLFALQQVKKEVMKEGGAWRTVKYMILGVRRG